MKIGSWKSAVLMTVVIATGFLPADKIWAQLVDAEVVCEGLSNPFGIAIEDRSDRIFIAESGLQRVVLIEDGKPKLAIDGFRKTEMNGYVSGPMGIRFMGPGNLWVGCSNEQGRGCLSLFAFRRGSKSVLKADGYEKSFKPKEVAGMPEFSNFSGITFCEENFYAIGSNGEKGWLSLGVFGRTLTGFHPRIPNDQERSGEGAFNFSGMAVDPLGVYLAATQIGGRSAKKDAVLTMYSLAGRCLQNYPLALRDPVALAYSKSGRMFVLDASFANPQEGGVFELIANGPDRCDVKEICSIPFGAGMAFDSSGVLYVTSLGAEAESANQTPQGKLLKIVIEEQQDSNGQVPSGE